jgi:polygalacturonase
MITISGRGTIDGNGFTFQDAARLHMGSDYERRFTRQGADFMHPRFGTQHGPLAHGDRPGNLVRFANCRNVLISGVTIQNSPTWTTHINRCDQVDILGVKINSLGSDCRVTNDDGIDLVRSKRVHIADCDIQTGDDCIALFGSEMVTMSNCTLTARSAGIRVGFFDEGDTSDCVFNNLVIHSNRGITVNVRGESSVENILFSNIILQTQLFTGHWWGKAEPIQVSTMPWDPAANHLGQIRNISFRNILAESESGILIYRCEQAFKMCCWKISICGLRKVHFRKAMVVILTFAQRMTPPRRCSSTKSLVCMPAISTG